MRCNSHFSNVGKKQFYSLNYSKMILFYSFKDWKKYILSAVRKLFVSLLRIVWAIVNGAASLVAGASRSIGAFTRREPKAMCVITFLLTFIISCWLINFVRERAMRVAAEMQRDSIALKLDSAKQNAYIREPFGFNHWNSDE